MQARQSPRALNVFLSPWLASFDFFQASVNPAVFIITSTTLIYVLVVYDDECILVGRESVTVPSSIIIKSAFSTRFEELGLASWLLGCCIVRDCVNMTLTFSQSQYAEDILDQFAMSACSSSPTPMSSKPSTDPLLDLPLYVKLFSFPSLLSKLLYYANMTRPNI
jgi:hypothetical protein